MPTENTNDWPQWWHNRLGSVRIMVIAEGYVMARRPKGDPFTRSIGEFKNSFIKGKKL